MNNQQHICVVTQQLKNIYSGPGVYSNLLIKELKKRNFLVTVILPEEQLPENPDFNFILVPNPIIKTHARWMELSKYFNRAIKPNVFDLIHYTDIRDSYFVKTSINSVANINDTYLTDSRSIKYYRDHYKDWVLRSIYYRISKYIEQKNVNRIDRIIANSQYTKNVVLKNYPFLQDKISVCYKTVDFSQMPRKTSSNSGFFNILFIGGNMERKGIVSLIKSSQRVIENLKNVKYHIVGQDPKIDYYKSICKKIGVENQFIFYGNLDLKERNELYGKADIFVMPSIEEALGIVFLEAMANEIPVIGSNVGGIPEIINDQENGFLINPFNIDELSIKMIDLLTDKDLRIRFIRNAKITLEKFSNEKTFNCLMEIYANLVRVKK